MEKLDIEKLRESLKGKIGRNIEYYEEINSTHLYAKKIAQYSENDGKMIIAEIQNAGIGTKGRNWYTGKGKNIALTIILKPKCEISDLENLTVDIAIAIKNAIKELYGYDLQIKKPNDLLIDNKKICGILTQINTIGEKINYLLISFGFNVNEDEFSDNIKDIATSLKKEYNKDFCREDIIIKIIDNLENLINKKRT